LAGTAVILFLGFSKLLSSPIVVEKKHPENKNKNKNKNKIPFVLAHALFYVVAIALN
jgi:hypothetical protein